MDSHNDFVLEINGSRQNNLEFKVKENQAIEILFNSHNKNSRLYLEALDVVDPDEKQVFVDDRGELYIKPSANSFYLLKSEDSDRLYVDKFNFRISSDQFEYNGSLEIEPKQLTKQEWEIMKEDLEKEVLGLARDLTKKRIGKESSLISPEKLRSYQIIKHNYKKILGAFNNLRMEAHYSIMTIENTKALNYDIQDNRLLKKIIFFYERILSEFITELEVVSDPNKYLRPFIENAKKLKKATALIKSEDWFKSISPITSGFIPHSFALDPRYSILYKLYKALKNPDFEIIFDEHYPFKRSSLLYEMWCYIKLCRSFEEECQYSIPFINFDQKTIFPVLKDNTKMTFYFENFKLEVIYNESVQRKPNSTSPLYTKSNHRKPDIIINVYSTEGSLENREIFLGSYVLECKYRKFLTYWKEGNKTREQISSYKYNFLSDDLVFVSLHKNNPVEKVFVLTPDTQVKKGIDPDIVHYYIRPGESFSKLVEIVLKDSDRIFKSYLKNYQYLNSLSKF